MKIQLTTPQSKRDISSVRSQIKDATSLKNFDDFVSKNQVFDFTNSNHLESLRKIQVDCDCHIIFEAGK